MATPKKRGAGTSIDHDDLSSLIAENINKGGVATYAIGEEESPADLTDFISTGASVLDVAISNRPYGGIACGRITEISGTEASGKSLIAAHLIANVQKEGGVAALLDTEIAINEDFFRAIGVQFSGPNKLIYANPDTIEDVFATIEKIIEIVRKSGERARSRKVLIVVDSVSNTETRKEKEAGYEKVGYGTEKPKIISDAMKKMTFMIAREKIALVFINQLRFKMNATPFSDPYTTSGGKAIPHAATTRLRLSLTGAIKVGQDKVGVKVMAELKKSRLGPPGKKIGFEVYFDRGIDDISSRLSYLKEEGLITGDKGKFKYASKDNQVYEFNRNTWSKFQEEHPKIVEEMYLVMCDHMVMKYKDIELNTLDGGAEVETEVQSDE